MWEPGENPNELSGVETVQKVNCAMVAKFACIATPLAYTSAIDMAKTRRRYEPIRMCLKQGFKLSLSPWGLWSSKKLISPIRSLSALSPDFGNYIEWLTRCILCRMRSQIRTKGVRGRG